jgi:hypothetical protein
MISGCTGSAGRVVGEAIRLISELLIGVLLGDKKRTSLEMNLILYYSSAQTQDE